VHRIGKGKHKGRYVELEREREDLIFTVLGEFGTQIVPQLGGTPGPLHNQIPEPDRTVDNRICLPSRAGRYRLASVTGPMASRMAWAC
jgi:hypothetical protein